MKLLHRYRYEIASCLAGILVVSLFATLQTHIILGLPLSLKIYVIPSLVGGTCGLTIGFAYFRLRDRESHLRTIFQAAHNVSFITAEVAETTTRIIDFSPGAEAIFGFQRQEVLGRSTSLLQLPEGNQRTAGQSSTERHRKCCTSHELLLTRKSGEQFPALVTAHPLFDRHGVNNNELFVVIDLSEQKRIERALRETDIRLQTILDSVHTGILVIDAETHVVVDANRVALDMIGSSKDKVIGSVCHNFLCPAALGQCPITDLGQVVDNSERVLLGADSSRIPVLKTVTSVILDGKKHLLESFIDITDRKKAAEEIEQLAYYDTLTGLPNRTLLKDRVGQALAHAARDKKLTGVLFLDLDRFKVINDTLGHSSGDHLLQVVANRLTNCVRKSDTVARLGGDEFVVVLNGIFHEEDSTNLAQKILDTVAEPVMLDGQEVFSSCSIGIALYPLDGGDVDSLLKNADAAMYQAKEQGRNNYQFYSRELNLKAVERLFMETSMRHSLERGEFVMYYQPQIDLATGLIVGVEALIRWNHPEMGLVAPGKFIPLAEETGLIIPMGEWVLRTACIQNKIWQNSGFPPLRMAVNLSIRQFRQKNLLDIIRDTLAGTGLSPEYLELELTESTIMENTDDNISLLLQLKEMGVKLAIDDFGTGYSSMSCLKLLPIDRLKIAQHFVRDIIADPDDAAIAEAIIAMAHSLKLKVIAEGVETKEQLEFLHKRKCDEVQGYYFARPMPVDEVTAMLAEGCGLEKLCFFTGEQQ